MREAETGPQPVAAVGTRGLMMAANNHHERQGPDMRTSHRPPGKSRVHPSKPRPPRARLFNVKLYAVEFDGQVEPDTIDVRRAFVEGLVWGYKARGGQYKARIVILDAVATGRVRAAGKAGAR